MASTFNGTYHNGVVLGSATQNPALIGTSGFIAIGGSSYNEALYGSPGVIWTVSNLGTVDGAGSDSSGIVLAAGGTVFNGAIDAGITRSLIEGSHIGVAIRGAAGVVVNDATISSSSQTIGGGVWLPHGGTVFNGAGGAAVGLITAYRFGIYTGGNIGAAYSGGNFGASYSGAAGTVANYGTIASTSTAGNHTAVLMVAGGSVHNAAGAVISSAGIGVGIAGAAGTVTSSGTISGGSEAVSFGFGGSLLINDGRIKATGGTGVGVLANAAATVTNRGTGYISGDIGIEINSAAGTVSNSATITASGTDGVGLLLSAGGSVSNGGLLQGSSRGLEIDNGLGSVGNSGAIVGTGAFGAHLTKGGSVNNSGSIAGGKEGIEIDGGAGTIANQGTIRANGSGGYAVLVTAGGVLTNGQSGSTQGLITGQIGGVEIDNGAATLINFATIASSGRGVVLGAAGAVAENYGVITGAANGATGAAVYLGRGGRVVNGGRITGAAFGAQVLGGAGTVTNLGTITAGSGTGVDLASAGSTLTNAGVIIGNGGTAVALDAAGDLVVIDQGAVFTGAVAVKAGGETLDFTGVAATGYRYSGGVLSLTNGGGTVATLGLVTTLTNPNFTLAGDGSGGTEVTIVAGGTTTVNQGHYLSGTYTSTVVIGANNPTTVEPTGVVSVAEGNAVVNQSGAAATLTNLGRIAASGSGGNGIYFNAGGIITNAASGGAVGVIAGYAAGIAITGGRGTIVNAGTIAGTGKTGVGVVLGAGTDAMAATFYTRLTNYSTVSGTTGVIAAGGDETIANAGAIIGIGGTAVTLAGGVDRLIVDPGAVFQGIADGGGTGVLELAGPPGLGGRAAPSVGTLAGIGSAFVNFGTLVVDGGDAWEASGDGSRYQFVNDGTIIVGNGIVAGGETLALGPVGEDKGDSGLIEVGSNGVLDLAASVAARQTIAFADATGTIELDAPAGFAGTIAGFQAGDILDVAGATGIAGLAGGTLELLVGGATAGLQFAASPGLLVTPDGNGGLRLASGGAGTLELAAAGGAEIFAFGPGFTGFSAIVVDAAAEWDLAGDISAVKLTNDGTVAVDSGNLLVFGAVGADPGQHGVIDLGGEGAVEFTGAVAKGQILVFGDATGALQLADPSAFAARITGFQGFDLIDLVSIQATGLVYAHGTLKVMEGKQTVAKLRFAGSFNSGEFALSADGNGGTDIVFAGAQAGIPAGATPSWPPASLGPGAPQFWVAAG